MIGQKIINHNSSYFLMQTYNFNTEEWNFNRILAEKETILSEIRTFILFFYSIKSEGSLKKATSLKEILLHFQMSLCSHRGTEPYCNMWDIEFKYYDGLLNEFINRI